MNDELDEIERRGFDFLNERRWAEARECFSQMLDLSMDTERRAKILRNLAGTYARERNNEAAIRVCQDALELIEQSAFGNSNAGARMHGYFIGEILRLSGAPWWRFFYPQGVVILSACLAGAAIGAKVGSNLVTNSLDIHGPVVTDLRYGGAGVGFVLGSFLFLKPMAMFPIAAMVTGVVALGAIWVVLTEVDLQKGLATLMLLSAPLAIGLVALLFRRVSRQRTRDL